jgi:hypothetical protein
MALASPPLHVWLTRWSRERHRHGRRLYHLGVAASAPRGEHDLDSLDPPLKLLIGHAFDAISSFLIRVSRTNICLLRISVRPAGFVRNPPPPVQIACNRARG